MVQGSLTQCLCQFYRTQLPWITRINYTYTLTHTPAPATPGCSLSPECTMLFHAFAQAVPLSRTSLHLATSYSSFESQFDLFHKYLLSISCVPSATLSAWGHSSVSKDPSLIEVTAPCALSPGYLWVRASLIQWISTAINEHWLYARYHAKHKTDHSPYTHHNHVRLSIISTVYRQQNQALKVSPLKWHQYRICGFSVQCPGISEGNNWMWFIS